jgi:methionyl-tRNA formyltransferase
MIGWPPWAGRMMVDALTRLAHGADLSLTHNPPKASATPPKYRNRKLCSISDSRAVLERRIRAFHPFPGAVAQIGDVALKVSAARLSTAQGEAGQVL